MLSKKLITLFSLLSEYSLLETRQSVFHVFYFPAGGGGGWRGLQTVQSWKEEAGGGETSLNIS